MFVHAVDKSPPQVMFCSQDIDESIELGHMSKQVFWAEPRAADLSGNVSLASQSHKSGDFFGFGKTQVKYVFSDETGNSVVCSFRILITSGNFNDVLIHCCL